MVDQFINQGQVDRNAVYDTQRTNPNVIYDVNKGGQGLTELVGALDGFINMANKKLDKETVRKAQLAGSMAGLNSNFKPVNDDTLAAEAYNRSGTEIYINKKVSDVSTSIAKTALDPNLMNNPTAMQHRLADMQAELSKDVPLEVLPQFTLAYEERANRAIQGAQEKQFQLQISANAAVFMEAEATLTAEATNAARDGNEEAINQSRAEYFSSINKQVGLSLSPLEAAKKKMIFNKQIQKDSVIGEFLRTPPDKRAAFATKFIEDNPLGDILTADEVEGLKHDMIGAWQVDDNLKDAAEAETVKVQKETADNALGVFQMNPTETTFADYVKLPGVEPAQAAAAKNYLVQNIGRPDPIVDYNITQAIRSGDYAKAKEMLKDPDNYGALPRERVQEHMALIEEMQNGAGFEKTDAYQEVQRRIRTEYSSSSIYGQQNSATGEAIQQQIYDELRTKYPKYLRGELNYEDVDPVRMYNTKKSNYRKTAADSSTGGGEEVMTSTQGKVVIPQKYIDDPALFEKDSKLGLGPGLSTPEVEMFMVEKAIAKKKEKAAGK